MSRRYPPLTAMMAAEAAARTGSIVGAAAELGVTAPAVSQQIKLLERHLGRRLFDRGRSGVTLTDAGRSILPYLAEGFDNLAKVGQIGPGDRSPGRIVVSAAASVALKWLPGAIDAIRRNRPDLRVELRMEEDPVDFGEGGPDIRIGYGELPYTGLVRRTLVRDCLIPVARPGESRSWNEDRLIHTDWGGSYASLPVWRDWAAAAGFDAPDPRRGQRAGASALAQEMAAEGGGVALANALFAARDLAAGRIECPFGPALPMRDGYTICHKDRAPISRDLADRLILQAQMDLDFALSRVKPPLG